MLKLKLNIQKTKIMTSSPITSWQVDGETVTDSILGGSKITADGDCSHEIRRRLFLGRNAVTNLDSMLKRMDITNKGLQSQSYGFSSSHIRMWGWTIKKVKRQRIDAFELWCWRRLLRVPRTARRSNQFILKEISPEYSLEELMLKLKLQYFGHLMQRTDSLIRKDPDAGKNWRREEKGTTEDEMIGWHHWIDGLDFDQAPGVGDGQGSLVREIRLVIS